MRVCSEVNTLWYTSNENKSSYSGSNTLLLDKFFFMYSDKYLVRPLVKPNVIQITLVTILKGLGIESGGK